MRIVYCDYCKKELPVGNYYIGKSIFDYYKTKSKWELIKMVLLRLYLGNIYTTFCSIEHKNLFDVEEKDE